jgi:KDO2-lipid IV(A) lauroyltransferase
MRDRLLAGLMRLFGLLPFGSAGRLGAAVGRLLYRLGGREVKNARVNLRLCFPQLDEAQREALVRRNLIETGRSMAQMLRVWVGRRLRLAELVDDNGFEAAGRRLLERGNGLIFALPHLGNWELIGESIINITPTTALYRPPRMAFMDSVMRAGRSRTGITPVPIDRQGLKALHAALQRGEGVVILPDQVPKTAGASGVVAPFFGHPAMTMTLIGRLARRHHSPVLFCCAVYDEASGRHRLHHFEGDPAIGADSLEEAAAALNRDVERCAREFPAHYQWTYRRFELPGARPRLSPYR